MDINRHIIFRGESVPLHKQKMINNFTFFRTANVIFFSKFSGIKEEAAL